MASSNNLTGAHITLILVATISVPLGVVTVMNFQDLQEARKAADEEAGKLLGARKAGLNYQDQINAVKEPVGPKFDYVFAEGDADNLEEPRSVIGLIDSDMRKYGKSLSSNRTQQGDVEPTEAELTATLQRMRQEIERIEVERNELLGKLTAQKQAYLAVAPAKKRDIAKAITDRDAAEAKLLKLIDDKDNEMEGKNAEIKDLEIQIRLRKVETEQEKVAWANEVKQQKQRITNLNNANELLIRKLDQARNVSFEKADGLIRWVDVVRKLVWINLGHADNLPKRKKFFVYAKSNYAITYGERDMKAEIEITQIHGPHFAEARILADDIFRPIAAGDLIFTPLWQPGQKEEFALVGLIEFTGDGKSDRKALHDLITAAGTKVRTEIDDRGQRIGKPVDVNTRFLVIGRIPGPNDAGTPEQKQAGELIRQGRDELIRECREHGVKIVNLNDFLAYIEYKPQPQLRAKPNTAYGEPVANPGGNQGAGNPPPSGTQTKVYVGGKRRRAGKSGERTLKIFRGGASGR